MTDKEQISKTTGGTRKVRVGRVVSERMNKTVVVAVERLVKHPLYKKYVKRTSRLYAHDERNDAHEGDTVRVVETRPLSKLKRWRVAAILERAK
jgi:small subunit ribosomal protein S17